MRHAFRSVASVWLIALLIAVFGGRTSGVAEVKSAPASKPATLTPAQLDAGFDSTIKPFLKTYCFECHSGEKPEAEFDLTTFTSMAAAVDEPALAPRPRDARDRGDAGGRRREAADRRRAQAQAVAWFQALRTPRDHAQRRRSRVWCWRGA